MFTSMWLPLIAGVVLADGVTTLHRRLVPALAAHTVIVSLVVIVVAAVPTLWIVSLDFLAHLSFGNGVQWCSEMLGMRRQVPAAVGALAIVASVTGAVRSVRLLRRYGRLRHDHPGAVEIASYTQPFAYTLPGRGGHVVVSSGLLELLDDGEQHVVLAHEHAHARHRHDRYVLIGQLASVNLPFLRPLLRRLQFSLERWADESAVNAAGGDRRFVARTLGKVALSASAPAGTLGINRLGVTARVAVLLSPALSTRQPVVTTFVWAAITGVGVLAGVQIHHLAGMLTSVCLG